MSGIGGKTNFWSLPNNPFAPSSQSFPLLEISGSKGGWQGLYFPAFEKYLLINGQFYGVFDKTTANWIYRVNNGVLDIGNVPWDRLTDVPNASENQPGLVSEESSGIWIPVLKGNSTPGSVTYGGRYGTYTKIGSEVKARFTLVSVSHSGIPLGEGVVIDGLPFPCASGSGNNGSLVLNYYSGISLTTSSYTQLAGRIVNGTSRIELMKSGSGVSAGNININGLTSGSVTIEGVAIYSAG